MFNIVATHTHTHIVSPADCANVCVNPGANVAMNLPDRVNRITSYNHHMHDVVAEDFAVVVKIGRKCGANRRGLSRLLLGICIQAGSAAEGDYGYKSK